MVLLPGSFGRLLLLRSIIFWVNPFPALSGSFQPPTPTCLAPYWARWLAPALQSRERRWLRRALTSPQPVAGPRSPQQLWAAHLQGHCPGQGPGPCHRGHSQNPLWSPEAKLVFLPASPPCATRVHPDKAPSTCLPISFCSACCVTAIHRRKGIRSIEGSLYFHFLLLFLLTDVYILWWCLLWAPEMFAASLGQQVPPRRDPACSIPRRSLLPCYYLLSSDGRCVTTGSSSKIFRLVNEETPHAYNREFRCAFLHTRVNRICYLFIFKTPRWLLCTFDLLSVWAAISYSEDASTHRDQEALIELRNTRDFNDLSPLLRISALEINNSEKKGMGLKFRKKPPVFGWQVPTAEAASELSSYTDFQTCSLTVQMGPLFLLFQQSSSGIFRNVSFLQRD